MTKLLKGALITDIHFGKKANSPMHNADCINFLTWFQHQVKNDPTIDHIIFLGDWHESRTSIDISTFNLSLEGASILNDIGLPVYVIVGNHDLYKRHSRDIHSTPHFDHLENMIVINHPTEVKEIGINGSLICPFIFKDEYTTLVERFGHLPTWFGHFEFKGFILTGYTVKLEHGPDKDDFSAINKIFSGHFHRRQFGSNVIYIGSCFPYDFGDANDFNRGLCVYDHMSDVVEFVDWPDCPKYIKTTMSAILDDPAAVLMSNSYVMVDVDVEVTFEDVNALHDQLTHKYELRSLTFDESSKYITDNIVDGDVEDVDSSHLSTDDLIITMLGETSSTQFDVSMLIDMYRASTTNRLS